MKANLMTNDCVDNGLGDVKIQILPQSKGEKFFTSVIIIDGNTLPFSFKAETKDEASQKASDFYAQKIFDSTDDYDFSLDLSEKILSLFNKNQTSTVATIDLSYLDNRKSKKNKGIDGRTLTKGTTWVVRLKEDGSPDRLRVKLEDVPSFVAQGFRHGRDWELTVKEKKTEQEGYVHPFKSTNWVNNGVNKLRIQRHELAGFLAMGWKEGMGTGLTLIAKTSAPIVIPSKVEDTLDTEEETASETNLSDVILENLNLLNNDEEVDEITEQNSTEGFDEDHSIAA